MDTLQALYDKLKLTGEKKRCGRCDQPVMSCRHELFVPTVVVAAIPTGLGTTDSPSTEGMG